MSAARYSLEEIEKKRLLAVERRKEAVLKNQTHVQSPSIKKTESIQDFSNQHNAQKPLQQMLSKFKYSPHNNMPAKKTPQWQYNQHDYKSVERLPKTNNRYQPINTDSFFNKKSIVNVKCSMININRFSIQLSDFVPSLVELFKTISSKMYDMKTRTWNFHIKDYESVVEKLSHPESGIKVTGIPRLVLQMFRKNLNSEDKTLNIDLSEIDEELTSILMPFQREGICFGISKHGRCIIADDMGLGKTIQALGIARHFKHDWPLLIVTPSSVRYQWSEAIFKFLPSIPAHYVHQFETTKDYIDQEKIIITSYDLLVRAVDAFERHIFGFVILDESHVVKNTKTARFRAVQRIVRQAQHVVLLSGTPALSRPIELFSQIELIIPKFMGFQEYGIRYCNGCQKPFGWDFTGSSNMLELQLLLKATCMIRRLKSEVLSQLPAKIRQVIMLDPALIEAGTKQMRKMSKALEQSALTGVEKHNALLQYYNESSVAKLKAVCNYVSDLLEVRKKFLIYAHHQNVLDAIEDIVESMKIRYIRIDGRTSAEERKKRMDEFQENSNCIVAILSITAANTGVTLTAANLVVFAELFWNPGILSQAEDRVHRIGQDNSVLIHYLVAKRTVDDYLWPLIQRKTNVLNEAGFDHNFSLKNAKITKQTLEEQKGQQKIESFFSGPLYLPDQSEDQSKETTGNKNESKCVIDNADELKDILEISAEDFDNCDWDEIV